MTTRYCSPGIIPTNLNELDTLITFMRERGAYRVKNGDFELELLVDFAPVAKEAESEAKSEEVPIKKAPKRGKDGLTPEMQEAVYGRVMSDTQE